MIDSIVRSDETYDAQIHDLMYDLKDDWLSRTEAKNTNSKRRGKNMFGPRGLNHNGSCTLAKTNSVHACKIIDHLLNHVGVIWYVASLERAFSMGKQLAPPHKSRLKVSTTASHLLIKTHYMLYREKREKCPSSKKIPVEFDAPCSLSEILEELEESIATNEDIDKRTLRHDIRKLKLCNIEWNSLDFPSKLAKLVPQQCVNVLREQLVSSESSESADLTHF